MAKCLWSSCDIVFNSIPELVNHFSETHLSSISNSDLFCLWAGCSHLKSSFSNKTQLLMHIRKHAGEKLYRCEECNKDFCRSDALSKHLKNNHASKVDFSGNIKNENMILYLEAMNNENKDIEHILRNKRKEICRLRAFRYILLQRLADEKTKESKNSE